MLLDVVSALATITSSAVQSAKLNPFSLDFTEYEDAVQWETVYTRVLSWCRAGNSADIHSWPTEMTVASLYLEITLFEEAKVGIPAPCSTWDERANAAGQVQDNLDLYVGMVAAAKRRFRQRRISEYQVVFVDGAAYECEPRGDKMSDNQSAADGFLAPEQAIIRWLFTRATEVPFVGPKRPNPDNVDYVFGLIGAKPGQSPAREALQKRRQTISTDLPAGPFSNLYVGGHSPNVDFSLFAFTPKLITRAFRCRLQPSHAGQAQFRIATCGRIRLWLGADMVCDFAPFSHNLETAREISLDLPEHEVDLTIELEELHERNTNNFFSVTYLSGTRLSVALGTMHDREINAVADTIDTLEAEKVFFEGEPLVLKTEKPLPHDQNILVTALQQAERADAHESLGIPQFTVRLGAATRILMFPEIHRLPTGCTGISVCSTIHGIEISKKIGTTILTRAVKLKGQTIDQRKAEVLSMSADDTGFEITVALANCHKTTNPIVSCPS